MSFLQTYVSELHFVLKYTSPQAFQKEQSLTEVLQNSLLSLVIKKWNLTEILIVPKTAVLCVCPLAQANNLPVNCLLLFYVVPLAFKKRYSCNKNEHSCQICSFVQSFLLWGSVHLHLLFFSVVILPSLKAQSNYRSDSWGK